MKPSLIATLSIVLVLAACTSAVPTATPVVVEKQVLTTVEVPVTREVEVTRVVEIPVTRAAEVTREIEVQVTEPAPVTVVVQQVVTATPAPTAVPSAPLFAIPRLTGGQPVTITLIEMTSGTEGWALGNAGDPADHLLRTADGGASWADVTPPEPAPASDARTWQAGVFFLDADSAWINYTGQTRVWRTRDGGLSWQGGEVASASNFGSLMAFVNQDLGWLMNVLDAGMGHVYVSLSRTADGGASWETLVDPHTTVDLQSCGKSGMAFRSDGTGWVTYDCGGLYDVPFLDRTADGGLTWESVELTPPPDDPELFSGGAACRLHSPALFGPGSGVVGLECIRYEGEARLSESYVYATADEGLTWSATPYAGGELQFMNPEVGLALARQIHRTGDGGRSWTLVGEVFWDGQFSFPADQLGWAVARSGDEIALVRTADGGRTWQQLAPQITSP